MAPRTRLSAGRRRRYLACSNPPGWIVCFGDGIARSSITEVDRLSTVSAAGIRTGSSFCFGSGPGLRTVTSTSMVPACAAGSQFVTSMRGQDWAIARVTDLTTDHQQPETPRGGETGDRAFETSGWQN